MTVHAYKIELSYLRQSSKPNGKLSEHVAMKVKVLDPSKLRTLFVRFFQSIDVNIWEQALRKKANIIVRCNDCSKIDNFPPGHAIIIRVVLVHVQNVVWDLAQAHRCYVEPPVCASSIDALAKQGLASFVRLICKSVL